MRGKEYFEEMIYRHLISETSREEENELNSWLKENPANQAEYDFILKIWKESSNLAYVEPFDPAAAWSSLENKISESDAASGKKKLIYWRRILAAAAIILLAILSELVYYSIHPKVPEMEHIIALQGNEEIRLLDGSVILLRKGGSIQYAKGYPQKLREVSLSGEAYFNVIHDDKKPFRIKTKQANIEDLGTAFMVNTNDSNEQVFVTRGSLRVTEIKDSARTIILTSGERLQIIGKIFAKEYITDSNYLSWQSGILLFDHVPLRKMILDLNQHYQVNISLSDSLKIKSDTIRVNFRFERNSLDQVLDEIKLTTGWLVERNNSRILLREK